MAGTVIITIGAIQWTGSYLSTESERVAGLAHIASIPPQTCAFFDCQYTQPITVTVADMLFNLDIAFIAENGAIVQIERNVAPGTALINYTSARYFMECNGGELAAVNVGDTIAATVYAQQPSSAIDLSGIIQPMITIMVVGMMVGMMKNFITPTKKTYNIYGRSQMAYDTRQDIMASARDELGHTFRARITGIRGI